MNEKTKPTEQPPQAPPPTMKCFIVPIEAMEQIRDALREAPHKYAKPVLDGLGQLQVADVPIGPPKTE
jgi:hypothetical protein